MWRTPGGCSARTATSRRSWSRTPPGRGRSPARARSSSSTSPSASTSRSRPRRTSSRRSPAATSWPRSSPGRSATAIGLARVITVASAVYGVGLLAGGLGSEWHAWYLGLIFVVAIAGGTVMTLAWGLLFKLMPPGERGAISGLATTTKGVGLVIGPLVAGAVIDILRPRSRRRRATRRSGPCSALPDHPRDPARRPACSGRVRGRRGWRAGEQGEAPDALVEDIDDRPGA